MAKKKSFFGTLVKLGGIAAATAIVYSKREEIRGFVEDVAKRYAPADPEQEPDYVECEPEIIIDATAVNFGTDAEETTEQ